MMAQRVLSRNISAFSRRNYSSSRSTALPSHLRSTAIPAVFYPPPPTNPVTKDTTPEIEILKEVVDSLAAEVNDGPQNKEEVHNVSGSHWTQSSLAALGVYWAPTNDVDSVLPKEFEPSVEELERYSGILSTNLDEKKLLGDMNTWGLREDSTELSLALKLQKLLVSVSPAEVYTDSFLEELLRVLGVSIPSRSPAVYNIKPKIEVKLGAVRYETTPDFAVYVPYLGKFVMAGPYEDKPLRPYQNETVAIGNRVSQTFSQMLGGALQNYRILPGAQEIFGVALRQQHFTFMHAHLSENYIDALRNLDPKVFTAQRVVLKSYPASLYGLDFAEPAQRLMIFKSFYRILKYCISKNSMQEDLRNKKGMAQHSANGGAQRAKEIK